MVTVEEVWVEVWEKAKADAQRDYIAALPDCNSDFVSSNIYHPGTEMYDEYEAAYEHYIMTLLGY